MVVFAGSYAFFFENRNSKADVHIDDKQIVSMKSRCPRNSVRASSSISFILLINHILWWSLSAIPDPFL